MMSAVKQVIDTDEDGAGLSCEQLADAGVKPGERVLIEIRPYSEEEWIAGTEGEVLSTDELVEHLRLAPGVARSPR
jgi:hypothetical protein